MNLIQNDLRLVIRTWNTHRIRACCPSGVPEELFLLPQPPAFNCLIVAHPDLPRRIRNRIPAPRACADEALATYLSNLCCTHNWGSPVNTDDASTLYHRLVQFL